MKLVLFMIASISMSASADRNKKTYRYVCYYSSKAASRLYGASFVPEMLNPNRCTHLVYAFAALVDNKITYRDPHIDLGENNGLNLYNRFNARRELNAGLKTLIAIGGWDNEMLQQNSNFSSMAKDPKKRQIFANSVREFLHKYKFDGISLDWTYPIFKGKWFSADDKRNYIEVLQLLQIGGAVISASLAVGKGSDITAYDVEKISELVDFVNLLTFDFHGPWEWYTGVNAPLFAGANETGDAERNNVDYVVRHWIEEGINIPKINLGIPLFGRCYTLEDRKHTHVGAFTKGPGLPGPYTHQPGYLGIVEICERFFTQQHAGAIILRDPLNLSEFAFLDDQWCSYDYGIIRIKLDYMLTQGIYGIMIWSYDLDMEHGECGVNVTASIEDDLKNSFGNIKKEDG